MFKMRNAVTMNRDNVLKVIGESMRKYPHSTTYVDELSKDQLREMIELTPAKPEPTEAFDGDAFLVELKARARARLVQEQHRSSVGK